jgi:hypothetical protein
MSANVGHNDFLSQGREQNNDEGKGYHRGTSESVVKNKMDRRGKKILLSKFKPLIIRDLLSEKIFSEIYVLKNFKITELIRSLAF